MPLHVKVFPNRDEYGFAIYEVKGENALEYVLTHDNPKVPKKGFKLFKVHCFRDRETIAADVEARKANAQKILDKPVRKR